MATDSVRQATLADRDAVEAIDRKVADADRRRLLRDAITARECLVFDRGVDVVGYAIVKKRHFFGRDFVELLVVDPEDRRQGVGRALLRAATAASTTPEVFTSTNASNVTMQALLASEDWSLSGQLTGLDADDPELVYYRTSA